MEVNPPGVGWRGRRQALEADAEAGKVGEMLCAVCCLGRNGGMGRATGGES